MLQCFTTSENMNLSLDLLASYKTYSFCHKIKDCYLQKDKTDIFLENGFSSFCTQNVVRALRLLDGLGHFKTLMVFYKFSLKSKIFAKNGL